MPDFNRMVQDHHPFSISPNPATTAAGLESSLYQNKIRRDNFSTTILQILDGALTRP